MEKTPFNKFLSEVKNWTYANRIVNRAMDSQVRNSAAQSFPKNVSSKLSFLNVRAAWDSNRDLQNLIRERQQAHPNPLTRYGRKCFSQADEDGITLEILRRIGIQDGTFCEFAVGNGLENNTLLLARIMHQRHAQVA